MDNLDLIFCKNDDDVEKRSEEKYRHLVDDNPNRVIPVIILYNGTIFDKSAQLINKLLPEIGPETLYKQIYREIAKSWSRVELLTQIRMNEVIEQNAIGLSSGE